MKVKEIRELSTEEINKKLVETKEELLDCSCGCGGDKVLCPNCGYEVRLPNDARPKKVKKQVQRRIILTNLFELIISHISFNLSLNNNCLRKIA